jgi:hypothetical protein
MIGAATTMTPNEQKIFDKLDEIVNRIHTVDIKFTTSITALQTTVHENNDIKKSIEDNSKAITACGNMLKDHLSETGASARTKMSIWGKAKWVIGTMLVIGSLTIGILGLILK